MVGEEKIINTAQQVHHARPTGDRLFKRLPDQREHAVHIGAQDSLGFSHGFGTPARLCVSLNAVYRAAQAKKTAYPQK